MKCRNCKQSVDSGDISYGMLGQTMCINCGEVISLDMKSEKGEEKRDDDEEQEY